MTLITFIITSECKIFAAYDVLQMNSLTTYLLYAMPPIIVADQTIDATLINAMPRMSNTSQKFPS